MKQYRPDSYNSFLDFLTGRKYVCIYNPTLAFLYKDFTLIKADVTHSWYKKPSQIWCEIPEKEWWPLSKEEKNIKYCDCPIDMILRSGCKCGGI